jgi:tetratricopeptide (TPR) repeat protein
MEVLKLRIFTLIFCLMTGSAVLGQNHQQIVDAFSSSYAKETAGDYKGGVDALKSVYNKDSYEINLRLGWLSYLAGMLDESQSYYQRAIALMPMGIEARFGLVYPVSSMGNWNQVINIYNEILKIDPMNTIASYRLGVVYYGRNDFVKARPLFQKVVDLYPFDYDGVIMLAWTNLKLGSSREAKILFQKALLFKPGDQSATEGLSLIK